MNLVEPRENIQCICIILGYLEIYNKLNSDIRISLGYLGMYKV